MSPVRPAEWVDTVSPEQPFKLGKVLSTVACNLDTSMLTACLPLLEAGKVEAMEWSFDALFGLPGIPAWFDELLMAFGKEGRLIGHGVFFSLFSGKWSKEHAAWLRYLKKICDQYPFDHITEHFGFMTGRDFHHGAPLNIPYTSTVLAIGIDRLKRIADTCQCPVGLENLAFSYSPDEVKRHGDFLQQLIEPVNGFIILDLHNLYCQSHNFSIALTELISLYPLDKVREIHISGGSWEPAASAPAGKVRRDTHDESVPEEVFAALPATMAICPNLKFVVMEQLGNGLHTESSRKLFYNDFIQMEKIVRLENNKNKPIAGNLFMPGFPLQYGTIMEDETLQQQQLELSDILESSPSVQDAISALQNSSLSNTEWQIENWQPYMIETACKIAQKWKKK
jgi:uncharacterized protein (UPF0276 family)